jgi:hypothetical protein
VLAAEVGCAVGEDAGAEFDDDTFRHEQVNVES